MTTIIEQRGLTELIARMRAYPNKLKAVMGVTIDATLLTLWEKVPPYPAPPGGSNYDRTGTLGRTLGSSEGGGVGGGQPSIYETREMGTGYQARFGSNLEYAEYVIGDDTQAVQNSHWWQMKDIAVRASEKIDRLWKDLGAQMAAFLDRQ